MYMEGLYKEQSNAEGGIFFCFDKAKGKEVRNSKQRAGI